MPGVRIICVGSRLDARDGVGPRVFDRLCSGALPSGVSLVDGGLQGLNLLREVEGAQRVVFVDTIEDVATDEVAVLDLEDVARGSSSHFGHSSGLGYLLSSMPHALDGPMPETRLVGAHPDADEPTIGRVAEKCLALAGGADR